MKCYLQEDTMIELMKMIIMAGATTSMGLYNTDTY